MKTKIKDLRDLQGLTAKVTVLSPVPTLRGPDTVDEDDEVQVRLAIGAFAVVLDITVDQYRRLAASLQPVNAAIALPIELPVEEEGDHE